MKFRDNLVIRIDCIKYTLRLDTEDKKACAGIMISQYQNRTAHLDYKTIDDWCKQHGVEYEKKLSYRSDKPVLWNIKEFCRYLWAMYIRFIFGKE